MFKIKKEISEMNNEIQVMTNFNKREFISVLNFEDGESTLFENLYNENRPSKEDEHYYSSQLDVLSMNTFSSFSEIEEEEELYDEYSNSICNHELSKLKRDIEMASHCKLSTQELNEIIEYISIFNNYECDQHWEVNQIISDQDRWNSFQKIRALNTHRSNYTVRGISPKYFSIICSFQNIRKGNGSSIVESKKY